MSADASTRLASSGEALFGLMLLQNSVVRPVDEAFARAHEASITGFEVLARLARMSPDGASVRYLADQVVVSQSRVSRVVEEFVARGLLERATSPQDGRLSLVRLTPRGREELTAMEATFERAVHEHLIDRLTPEQVIAIGEITQALGGPAGC